MGEKYSNDELEDLITRISKEDRSAMDLLYNDMAPYLKGYISSTGVNFKHQDDVIQETMIVIWRKAAKTFRFESSVRSFVFGIARFKCLDHLDQYSNAVIRNTVGGDVADVKGGNTGGYHDRFHKTPEENMQDDNKKGVFSYLSILPFEQRTALLLHVYGMKYKEIADLENIPIGTVRSRISLSKDAIRKLMNNDPDQNS